MAAVLACGPVAALSHASAAALWDLRSSAAVLIDVGVRTAGGFRARRGLRIHRLGDLRADEIDVLDAIPVTTVARTLLDLAALLPPRRLERALDQAEVRGRFDLRSLRAILDDHPGHHGAGRSSRSASSPSATRRRSADRASTLASPASRSTSCSPPKRLVVEVDGFRCHRTRAAFERDRERDAILARAGVRVLRFTQRQLTADAGLVAAALRSSA